ncbi:hypothetical protein QBC37DRAFT_482760 [Rhypophila decipiens]|uniref:Uncharacterized protein n=1 Tax=Rhypophila decipiens TaxID=261697 RepID=A0AAN7BAC8_9PEZI|nr:hypothetical protein QBC37DRAFT_482760 [Rhypophila decipiens]
MEDMSTHCKRNRRENTNPSLFRIWRIEIFCMLGSVICLIAMAVVLYVVNNRPLQSLTLHLNLNTIVTLLVALSKGFFMVPVTEALGQWKWNWFHGRPRSVGWLLVLDSASRSLIGALDLIVQAGLKHVASLGAFIYVTSIIMSLATQEVIFYRSELVPTKTQARIWSAETQELSRPKYVAALIDKSVIKEILRYQDAWQQVPGSGVIYCPSVDCTFPLFESVSICMESADITSHLQVNEIKDLTHSSYNSIDAWPKELSNSTTGIDISIPPVLSVALPSPFNMFYYLVPINKSVVFPEDQVPYQMGILNWVLIQAWQKNNWPRDMDTSPISPSQIPDYEVTAVEVLVHACVKTYNISVSNGTNLFQTTPSEINFWRDDDEPSAMEPRTGPLVCTRSKTGDPVCQDHRGRPSPNVSTEQVPPPLKILSKTSGSSHSIGGDTLTFIAKSLSRHLAGWGFSMAAYDNQSSNQGADTFASVRLASIFDPLSYKETDKDTPRALFQNITESLNGLVLESIAVRHHDISGTAWVSTTVVEVRWAWLSFLAVEIVLVAVFLIWTVIETNKMGVKVWKNSTLATMLTLDEESRRAVVNQMGAATSHLGDGHVHLRLMDDQLVYAGNKTPHGHIQPQ